jgi:ribulose 1,5-bisphosphate synthetase/thiazole synthase
MSRGRHEAERGLQRVDPSSPQAPRYCSAVGHVLEGQVPTEDSFDMVVIGSGPAGEKAAAQAAYFGKRVAVVEQSRAPGGAAVSNASIPSKTLRETAMYITGFRRRDV